MQITAAGCRTRPVTETQILLLRRNALKSAGPAHLSWPSRSAAEKSVHRHSCEHQTKRLSDELLMFTKRFELTPASPFHSLARAFSTLKTVGRPLGRTPEAIVGRLLNGLPVPSDYF